MPRMVTVYMDQISEHQRDLTNSASSRTYGETIAYVVSMAKRLKRTMNKLKVDPSSLQRNFEIQGDLIAAEPLYIMLAAYGHPDAHEEVRKLTLEAQVQRKPLGEMAVESNSLRPFISMMTSHQLEILRDPSKYIGVAAEKAQSVAKSWKHRLQL